MEHPALLHSLVCVSSNEGTLVFEHFLTEFEILDGSSFIVPVNPIEKYNLTIMNEYSVDTLNEGEPFFYSFTYCEIDTQVQILKFQHPIPSPFYQDRYAHFKINNCPALERFINYTDAHFPSYRQRTPKNELWTQINYAPGEDIFIVLKAMGDPIYRYIYFDTDQIDLNDKYGFSTLDWRQLPTDLSQTEIEIPFSHILHNGYIKGVNSKTNHTCYFYKIDSTKDLQNNITLFFPSGMNFTDIKTNLSFKTYDPPDNFTYNYHIVHGTQIQLPPFRPEYFEIENFKRDSFSIQTDLTTFPDYYRLVYIKPPIRRPQVGDYLYHITYSYWQLYGRNNSHIHISLPRISTNIMSQFNSNSSFPNPWFMDSLDLIKPIDEKDVDIDWINFLYDYNLLFVTSLSK